MRHGECVYEIIHAAHDILIARSCQVCFGRASHISARRHAQNTPVEADLAADVEMLGFPFFDAGEGKAGPFVG